MAEELDFAPVTPDRWSDLARRETYRPLGGGEYPELRGSGVAGRLLDAACEEAARAGADVIEAYPVDPDSPSYRFMGLRPRFLAAGFAEIGRVGKRRHAMRRCLRPGGARGHSAGG